MYWQKVEDKIVVKISGLEPVKVDPSPDTLSSMHPLSSAAAYQQSMASYGSAAAGMEGQQSPPEGAGSPQDPANGGNGAGGPDQHQNGGSTAANYSDINQLLDQILNITEQSLDEAQVRRRY